MMDGPTMVSDPTKGFRAMPGCSKSLYNYVSNSPTFQQTFPQGHLCKRT